MKLTRVYSGSDGQSHFGEFELPVEDKPGVGPQSISLKATEVFYRENKGGHESDWHRATQKQFVVLLEGELEVEVGDGSKHRFTAGDIFLCEDATGQGHKVRGRNRKTVVVRLA